MTPVALSLRRASYWTLCLSLVLILPLAGVRSMRAEGLHQVVGVLLFAMVALSAWWLSRPLPSQVRIPDPRLRLAGSLLLAPFALIALLWVGIGTPWEATPSENTMRYAVLLTGVVAITVAVFLAKELLCETGERLYSALALAASVLSAAAFLVWASFQMGFHALVLSQGQVPVGLAAVNNVLDALLFAAGCLAYAMTAALAYSLGKARWLGPKAALGYVLLNILALALLLVRGVSFPSPNASPDPWYTRLGFIVGIPAMPWVMPFLLGAVLLRRCSDAQEPQRA
jgi:hypothetical protein